MRQSVKMLSVCLTVFAISGCTKTTQLVPQRCITPTVEKPTIENGHCPDLLSSTKQCLKNYTKMKAYAAKLEEANKVCR